LVQIKVDHPWLNLGDAVDGVDAEDPIHPGHIEDPCPIEGDGTSREAGTGSPRHERDAKLRASGDDTGDFRPVLEKEDSPRSGTMESETITIIESELSLVGQDAIGREERGDGVQPPSIVAFEPATTFMNLSVSPIMRHNPSFWEHSIATTPVASAV